MCVYVIKPNMQPKYKMRKSKNHRYFGYEVETLCTKEKNHSVAAKLRKSTNRRNN
jgi:hypothetical protein